MTPEAKSLNVEDLSSYVIVGISRDTGEAIVAASQGLTLPDMGMLIGRLVADLALHITRAGVYEVVANSQRTPGNIITPKR